MGQERVQPEQAELYHHTDIKRRKTRDKKRSSLPYLHPAVNRAPTFRLGRIFLPHQTRMLMLLSMCVCTLLLGSQAQDRASMWRGNDRSGLCQYSFTVASPGEASCPQVASGPELEGLKTRLGLLEALVSRLAAGDAGSGSTSSGSEPGLRDVLDQAVGERNLLRAEKQLLEGELEALQRRMEDMRKEMENLGNRPCPPQRTPQTLNPALQDSSLDRPSGGKRSSSQMPQNNI